MNVLPRATCCLLITLVHNSLHPKSLHILSFFSVEFREKKLLVSSEDYGRDLTGVQNLRKKHKRLEAELAAHEPAIQVNASPNSRFLYKQHPS